MLFRSKGRVVDAQRQPLDYVNVVVATIDGNTIVKGSITDTEGNFAITDIPLGRYVVKVSFIGYTEFQKGIEITATTPIVDLGNVRLKEDATMLDGVEVTGQASQMRFDIDKKVFNVDQNLAAAGASASEMLANIPSVEVDNEGNVSLRNNSSVEVWINGKPSGLDADNRAQILEQMPAGSIESVELITNPSAKYNPEGTAGIINLVMKKDRKAGYFGSVQAGVNYPWGAKYPGGNVSANINYNSSVVDAYANIGYRMMNMEGKGYTNRYTFRPNTNRGDTLSHLLQNSQENRLFGGLFVRAGLDFHLTDKQTLGAAFTGHFGTNQKTSTTEYTIEDMLNSTSQHYLRDNNEKGGRNSYNVSLDYLYEIDRKGSEWRTSLSYSNNGHKMAMNYNQIYLDGSATDYKQYQQNNVSNQGVEFKSDYVQKFQENMKLEAGVFGSWRDRFAPSRAYDLFNNDQDSTLVQYNDFRYTEYIAALYATFGAKFGDFSFQAGLRGEYTNTFIQTRDAEILDYETTRRSYFELYPTAYLSYALPRNNEIQLNYTRRINRPRGRQLNAFKNLSDSTDITFGNPLLNPEFASALEFNYIKTWDYHAISGSLYYRYMDDVVQQVRFLGADNVMYTTYENIAQQHTGGLELVAKNRIAKWFNLTSTVNLYYSLMEDVYYDSDLDGQLDLLSPRTEGFSWNIRLMGNFLFGKGWSGQLTGGYNSPRIIAQGESKATYRIDLGVRKTFLDRKLVVALNVRDLLQSHGWRNITYADNFWQDYERQGHGTMIGLSVTYNFGNMKQKGKKPGSDMQNGGGGDDMDFSD